MMTLLSWQLICLGQPQTLQAIVNAVKMSVKMPRSRRMGKGRLSKKWHVHNASEL